MRKLVFGITLAAGCLVAASAQAAPVFVQLTGLAGTPPEGTAVYKADLSGSGSIQSVTIADNSSGLGGAPGQFSGFDLDAIVLSYTDISDAANVGTLVHQNLFDFSPAGTLFTPGAQRVPVDPKLFGTDGSGSNVDNAIATLNIFDGVNSTATPAGFVSMGDNGILSFNLSSSIDTTGLFLYIGEVGNNGEVAAARITVSQNPVPEPGTMTLIGSGLLGLVRSYRRRRAA